ncbi:large ribosomal subunit protein mL53 [Chironomus tepperi]|uniref:large ribosomal subunit protein mL53 n=1 Tax=Chironomus tepperi TaxID=113505 RepID=UPI00391EE6DD
MSVPFSGTFTRSGGVLSAIAKQIKLLNFRAVNRVTVKFDPFHENANNTRDFLHAISTTKVSQTNPSCLVKTDIVCNRDKPLITFQFIPSIQEATKIKTIKVEADNLSLLELLKVTNEQITARAPKEDPVSTLKTKSEKKGAVGKRR